MHCEEGSDKLCLIVVKTHNGIRNVLNFLNIRNLISFELKRPMRNPNNKLLTWILYSFNYQTFWGRLPIFMLIRLRF